MASDIKEFKRKVKGIKRDFKRKPRDVRQRIGQRAVADMKAKVVEHDAVASTELFRGIRYIKGAGIIRSEAPHSGFVEFGTGPKHVPNPYTPSYGKPEFSRGLVAELIEWAAVKPSLQTDNPATVGYFAARSISGVAEDSEGGTEPQPFFVRPWNRNKAVLLGAMERELEKSLHGGRLR